MPWLRKYKELIVIGVILLAISRPEGASDKIEGAGYTIEKVVVEIKDIASHFD